MQKLCDELEVVVKRLRLPERSVLALADAAMGFRLRNPSYRTAADVSQVVAGRDLGALAKAGLLQPKGERRGRYYVASPSVVDVRRRVAETKSIADPFDENPAPVAGTGRAERDRRLPGMERVTR
jgi:hypothetical protein